MRRRLILLAVLMLVVIAFAALTPAAFAGRVTRIMYAQENFDSYMYKATGAGELTITCTWWPHGVTHNDANKGPVWPWGSVNVVVQTLDPDGEPTQPYADYDTDVHPMDDLYSPYINPVTNSYTPDVLAVTAGQEVWIGVVPYTGDWDYELKVVSTGAGQWYGKDGAGPAVAKAAGVTTTVSGYAYGAEGDVWVHNIGQWFGTGIWPGNEYTNTALTNWNLYAAARDEDYVSGYWPEWTYPWTWTPDVDANTYTGNGATDGSTLATADIKNNNINKWISVQPQLWSAAAQPNTWPTPLADPAIFYYPKPGSITFDKAPLWYTYSYIDSDYQTKPGYMWGSVTPATVTDWFSATAAPSKRSYSSNAASGSTITWRFQGQNFTWVYNKGVKGGIQKVTVDGVNALTAKGTVDQFSSSFQYQQSTSYNLTTDFGITGTATTWHKVVVTGTGSTNSTSKPQQRFIYHDCFIDPDEPAFSQKAENNYDGQTVYTWDVVTPVTPPSGMSGTAYASTRDNTSGLAYTFQTVFTARPDVPANRYIKWSFLKGPKGGIQKVYLDGRLIDVIDQYSATFSASSVTYRDQGTTSLPGVVISMPVNSWHTIFITGSGQTNSTTNPQQRFIYHDAFTVEGAVVEE